MTTLLQEFEEWLKDKRNQVTPYTEDTYRWAIEEGLRKLEELKKKHNVV
jgi:hypothetical protein